MRNMAGECHSIKRKHYFNLVKKNVYTRVVGDNGPVQDRIQRKLQDDPTIALYSMKQMCLLSSAAPMY